jgi:O-antigen/teichoic acid export membrane protein
MIQTPTHTQTPKKALLNGAAWTVGSRWLIKFVGFVNTLIVARLVEPKDYGIIAMAFLVVGLTQALLDFGASTALLRKEVISREEIDSAWTLTVVQGFMTGLIVLCCAPLAGNYFAEPKLVPVLWVLAGCLSLSGLTNIGLTVARKNLQFSVDFQIVVGIKFLGVLSTVVAAYFLRDYRALLVGVVMGYVAGFILSYLLHPYRPRWNRSKIPEIWAVTKWLMLAGVGGFFLRKSDELVAGRIGSTAEFGLYNVGSDVGQLPAGELGPAILRAFLPVLSSIQADVARTNQAVLKTLAAVNTLTLPVGFGFAAVATPATALILGDKWLAATPFVACFALAGAVQFAMSPLSTLLVLRGHTRIQNHVVWIEFAIFAVMAAILVPHMHLLGLVWARIAGSLVNALVTAASARSHCGLPLSAMTQALWRPLLGSVAMYLLVTYSIRLFDSAVLQLAAGITTGAVLFASWTAVSWLLVGRPEGVESTVFDFFAQRAARKRHAN